LKFLNSPTFGEKKLILLSQNNWLFFLRTHFVSAQFPTMVEEERNANSCPRSFFGPKICVSQPVSEIFIDASDNTSELQIIKTERKRH